MGSKFDTKERFILSLSGKIKIYILSMKPLIIEAQAFIKHIYYYAFYDFVKKYEDRFDIKKSEMMSYIEKAFLIAVSEIGLYRYESGRYLLCANSI
jgi:hypothetical protein